MGPLDETGLAWLGEDEVKRESFTSYNEKKSLLKNKTNKMTITGINAKPSIKMKKLIM